MEKRFRFNSWNGSAGSSHLRIWRRLKSNWLKMRRYPEISCQAMNQILQRILNKLNLNSYYRKNNARSEEHTSELQSRGHLVCRLLLEKKIQIILKYLQSKL